MRVSVLDSLTRWPVRARATVLLGWWLAMGVFALAVPRLPQPAAYHAFRDARLWLGIPHVGDVLSNGAFLAVGLAGLFALAFGRARRAFDRAWQATPYAAFFFGLVLVSVGSAYYHWAPGDATLFWDRAAMSVTFSALAAVFLADRVAQGWGVSRGLPLFIALGLGGVLAWRLTGDVTYYFVGCQLAPLGSILLTVLFFRSGRTTDARGLFGLAMLYALAVVFEHLDAPIFELGRVVSGHTLKHLAAAAAVAQVLPMLGRAADRRACPVTSPAA